MKIRERLKQINLQRSKTKGLLKLATQRRIDLVEFQERLDEVELYHRLVRTYIRTRIAGTDIDDSARGLKTEQLLLRMQHLSQSYQSLIELLFKRITLSQGITIS